MRAPCRFAAFCWIWLLFPGVALGADCPATSSAPDSWCDAPALPTARRLLAAAAIGDKLYTFGGCGSPCFQPPLHLSTTEETAVEIYNASDKTWSLGPTMPTILYGAAAVANDDGLLYTLGGYLSGNVLQEYNPINKTWALKRPMPTPRYGLAAVAVNHKIYAIGGSGPSHAFEVYDPATDHWDSLAPLPTARVFLSAVVVKDKIYAMGGSPDCCGNSQTDVVEIYDLAAPNPHWQTGPPLPIAEQTSAAAATSDGRIFVLGGFIPGVGVQGATFEFDPDDPGTWSAVAPMTTPKDQAPAAVLKVGSVEKVMVVGGSVHCHCMALNGNESYTPPELKTPQTTADLAITNEVNVHRAMAGQPVQYTLTVTNGGPDPVTGAVVTDTFPPTLIDVRWTCQASSMAHCTQAGQGNHLMDPHVDLRTGDTLTYTVNATIALTATGTIVDTASVAAPTGILDPVVANNDSMPAIVQIDALPHLLSITKTASAMTARPGETITYTIVVNNLGQVPVTATVTDLLSATGLDHTSNLLATVHLAAGEQKIYGVTGTVPANYCLPSITNTACVQESGKAPICDTAPVAIEPLPITFEKTGPVSVPAGEIATYTLTITNPGACFARGVRIAETPPAGFTFVPGTGLCGGGFPCFLGALPPGKTVVQAAYRAPAGPCGQIFTNTATVTTAADPAGISAAAPTTIDCPCAGVTVTKTDGVTTAFPGDSLLYTLTVHNGGSEVCALEVSDPYPSGLTDVVWCRGAGCTLPAPPQSPPPVSPIPNSLEDERSLAGGETEVYLLSGTVSTGFAGPLITNTATVSFSAGEIQATDVDTILPIPPQPKVRAFCAGIGGPFVEGEVITYTVVLVNDGPDALIDSFTDTLPAGLTLQSASATSGVIVTAANTATWNGSVPAQGSVVLGITAKINPGTLGTEICNSGTLSDGTVSSSCCMKVEKVEIVPSLSDLGLAMLALLLAVFALRRLR